MNVVRWVCNQTNWSEFGEGTHRKMVPRMSGWKICAYDRRSEALEMVSSGVRNSDIDTVGTFSTQLLIFNSIVISYKLDLTWDMGRGTYSHRGSGSGFHWICTGTRTSYTVHNRILLLEQHICVSVPLLLSSRTNLIYYYYYQHSLCKTNFTPYSGKRMNFWRRSYAFHTISWFIIAICSPWNSYSIAQTTNHFISYGSNTKRKGIYTFTCSLAHSVFLSQLPRCAYSIFSN